MSDLDLDVSAEKTRQKFHALVDASFHFNSDRTQIIGRDNDGSLLFVALLVRGEEAEAVVTFLEMLDLRNEELAKPGDADGRA